MAYWLYQMSSNYWSSGQYRVEVWEGEHTNWPTSKKVPKDSSLQPGDIMILFYAPSGEPDPGVYGWSVVIRGDDEEVRFIPSTPSDYMKMNPMWDDDVKIIIDKIRGPVAMGTLWEIKDNLFMQLRLKMADHR